MFGEDYEDEEELPPEIQYRDLRRRSFEAAALWVIAAVVLGIVPSRLGFIVAGAGTLGALALAAYWHVKLRRLSG